MDNLLRLQKLHNSVELDKGDRLKSGHESCIVRVTQKNRLHSTESRNELSIQKIVQGALIKMKNVRRIHCPISMPFLISRKNGDGQGIMFLGAKRGQFFMSMEFLGGE